MLRNVRVLNVTEGMLAALLTERPGCRIKVAPGLPEGFQVVRVLPQRPDGSFGLLVAHPSFEEVLADQWPPAVGVAVTMSEDGPAAPAEAPPAPEVPAGRGREFI